MTDSPDPIDRILARDNEPAAPLRVFRGAIGDPRSPLRYLTTGDMELQERQALRRVPGLSTELQDVTEVEYRELRL